MDSTEFVAALDIGTSSVRCHLINKKGVLQHSSSKQIELLYPKPGCVEINPDNLWNSIIEVIKEAINGGEVDKSRIKCIGISCQRCTFITWNRKTNKHYHNFITWKDLRANSLVSDMNDSYTLKILQFGAKCLYTITRNKRYLAGSVMKFMNGQVTLRLIWVLKNIPHLLEEAEKGEVAFGTLDTWLLYKFSKGNLHFTDVSSASATGLFDPFVMSWADWAINWFCIPRTIFPDIVDSAGDHFGSISKEILGFPLPIRCLIADQSASLFGACCFQTGEFKITMGTGTFLNVNTGKIPHASVSGLYPVVGWKFKGEMVYLAEGSSNDTGSLIQWALNLGLMQKPVDSAILAQSVEHSDGVFFVPAFSGLQAPVNDSHAGAGFIGIKPTSRKEHLLRAILEAIVFRVTQIFHVFKEESSFKPAIIKVDGGVSRNDFITQLLADVTGVPVIRPCSTETSALGAAYLAGFISGIWKTYEELTELNKGYNRFYPKTENNARYIKTFSQWSEAVNRFCGWYNDGK